MAKSLESMLQEKKHSAGENKAYGMGIGSRQIKGSIFPPKLLIMENLKQIQKQ